LNFLILAEMANRKRFAKAPNKAGRRQLAAFKNFTA
jgi:hypothetical protein